MHKKNISGTLMSQSVLLWFMGYNTNNTTLLVLLFTELVTCENGDIRLMGGGSDREGRVEICIDSRWGTVCDDQWDSNEASVVCRQLDFKAEETSTCSAIIMKALHCPNLVAIRCIATVLKLPFVYLR